MIVRLFGGCLNLQLLQSSAIEYAKSKEIITILSESFKIVAGVYKDKRIMKNELSF